jgi:hypothetical protein
MSIYYEGNVLLVFCEQPFRGSFQLQKLLLITPSRPTSMIPMALDIGIKGVTYTYDIMEMEFLPW